jgi:hypothetical protein
MDLDKITSIKFWLKFGEVYRKTACPFQYEKDAWKICINLFPKMNNFQRNQQNICGCYRKCPCAVYGIKEVSAIAEEVVKEYEKV